MTALSNFFLFFLRISVWASNNKTVIKQNRFFFWIFRVFSYMSMQILLLARSTQHNPSLSQNIQPANTKIASPIRGAFEPKICLTQRNSGGRNTCNNKRSRGFAESSSNCSSGWRITWAIQRRNGEKWKADNAEMRREPEIDGCQFKVKVFFLVVTRKDWQKSRGVWGVVKGESNIRSWVYHFSPRGVT